MESVLRARRSQAARDRRGSFHPGAPQAPTEATGAVRELEPVPRRPRDGPLHRLDRLSAPRLRTRFVAPDGSFAWRRRGPDGYVASTTAASRSWALASALSAA